MDIVLGPFDTEAEWPTTSLTPRAVSVCGLPSAHNALIALSARIFQTRARSRYAGSEELSVPKVGGLPSSIQTSRALTLQLLLSNGCPEPLRCLRLSVSEVS